MQEDGAHRNAMVEDGLIASAAEAEEEMVDLSGCWCDEYGSDLCYMHKSDPTVSAKLPAMVEDGGIVPHQATELAEEFGNRMLQNLRRNVSEQKRRLANQEDGGIVPQPEKVWRHLVKRMFDECGTEKAEDFIRRVEKGEHDVPSPWQPSGEPQEIIATLREENTRV